jgi:hypothetical protein
LALRERRLSRILHTRRSRGYRPVIRRIRDAFILHLCHIWETSFCVYPHRVAMRIALLYSVEAPMLREYPRVRESCNAILGRPLVWSRHIPGEDCSYLKTRLEITSKSSARTYASSQVFFFLVLIGPIPQPFLSIIATLSVVTRRTISSSDILLHSRFVLMPILRFTSPRAITRYRFGRLVPGKMTDGIVRYHCQSALTLLTSLGSGPHSRSTSRGLCQVSLAKHYTQIRPLFGGLRVFPIAFT